MSGPPAKQTRRRRNAPALGEWRASPGVGWPHGPVPEPPDGLIASSREAWRQWFTGWWASNWSVNDLAGLEVAILHYDAVRRANPPKANDVTALIRIMDTYGITPAGQQARRWAPPKVDQQAQTPIDPSGRYGHLRSVAG